MSPPRVVVLSSYCRCCHDATCRHITFIQVLAAGLGADPTEAGTLASATGWGNVVGCLGCAVLDPRRIGLVFTLGMLGASACLALTAVDSYIVCLLGLFFANGFGGLFGAMQATLVMQALPPVLHGSGMGTLSLAIGAQAVGGLLIGETAELVSPGRTMLIYSGLGVGSQLLFSAAFPACARMVAPRQQVVQ